MKITLIFATGLLAAALSPVAAYASSALTVTDASVYKQLEWEGTTGFQFFTSSTLGTSNIDHGNAHLAVTALGAPYPLASVTASNTDNGNALMGSARLTYHYVVAAADTTKADALALYLGTPVVISHSSTGATGLQSTGTYYVSPHIFVDPYYVDSGPIPLSKAATVISGFYGLGYTDGGFSRLGIDADSSISSLSRECSAYAGPCGSGSYAIFGQLTRDASNPLNFLGTVNLFVEAGLNDVGTAFAYADPMISLNLDFGFAPEDFSIQLSDGFTNATEKSSTGAVPEPGSWALMMLGFAIAGSALRRQHRVRVSFA